MLENKLSNSGRWIPSSTSSWSMCLTWRSLGCPSNRCKTQLWCSSSRRRWWARPPSSPVWDWEHLPVPLSGGGSLPWLRPTPFDHRHHFSLQNSSSRWVEVALPLRQRCGRAWSGMKIKWGLSLACGISWWAPSSTCPRTTVPAMHQNFNPGSSSTSCCWPVNCRALTWWWPASSSRRLCHASDLSMCRGVCGRPTTRAGLSFGANRERRGFVAPDRATLGVPLR